MTFLVIVLFLMVVATAWHFTAKNAQDEKSAREAALRIETQRAVQAQRAKEDAAGVTEAAAQEPAKRKHRKKED